MKLDKTEKIKGQNDNWFLTYITIKVYNFSIALISYFIYRELTIFMSQSNKKSQVYADIPKNRLYIILRGTVSSEDIDNIYLDIRFCVADLQPGFSVITDMTEAKIAQLAGIATFKKISRFLLDNEVRTVVRVIDNPGIIVKQLARLTELIQGYKPIYVKSRTEAEKLLDEAYSILEKAL